jgi:hypothetical protein
MDDFILKIRDLIREIDQFIEKQGRSAEDDDDE